MTDPTFWRASYLLVRVSQIRRPEMSALALLSSTSIHQRIPAWQNTPYS
jgi:hypothetical protein